MRLCKFHSYKEIFTAIKCVTTSFGPTDIICFSVCLTIWFEHVCLSPKHPCSHIHFLIKGWYYSHHFKFSRSVGKDKPFLIVQRRTWPHWRLLPFVADPLCCQSVSEVTMSRKELKKKNIDCEVKILKCEEKNHTGWLWDAASVKEEKHISVFSFDEGTHRLNSLFTLSLDPFSWWHIKSAFGKTQLINVHSTSELLAK